MDEPSEKITMFCLVDPYSRPEILPDCSIERKHFVCDPRSLPSSKISTPFILYAADKKISEALGYAAGLDGTTAVSKLILDNIGEDAIINFKQLPHQPMIVLHKYNKESQNIALAFVAGVKKLDPNRKKIAIFVTDDQGKLITDNEGKLLTFCNKGTSLTFEELLQNPYNESSWEGYNTKPLPSDLQLFLNIRGQNVSISSSIIDRLSGFVALCFLDNKVGAGICIISLAVLYASYKAICR